MVREVYPRLEASLTTSLRRVVETVIDPVRDGKELFLFTVKLERERRGRGGDGEETERRRRGESQNKHFISWKVDACHAK